MAEFLPELMGAMEAKKLALVHQLSGALNDPRAAVQQLLGGQQDATNQQNQAVMQAMQAGNMPGVTAAADQGMPPLPATGGAVGDAVAAARSQLAHYQLPVFERLLAATGDPQAALAQAQKLTNLMAPTPQLSDITQGLGQAMLKSGVGQ